MRTGRTAHRYTRALASRCAILLSGLLAFSLGAGEAVSQGVDCGRLQSQLASAGRGNPALAARYAAAANRQQTEIERTSAYAQSIGCGNRQFLFFGSAPPAQCGSLQARIQQMRANVASLQAQAQSASGEGQRRDLQARYDAWCRGGQPSRNLFDTLFGDRDGRVQVPIEDPRDGRRDDLEDDDPRPQGGSQAMCVRTCDGGFFPVSYSARRSNLDDLGDLCRALCPNVEAVLYTHAPSRGIDEAISIDGEPYSALRNAGKYRTKFDPACTCKPPHKSWVEALADAEALLGRKGKNDILVTPEKSDEMARPKPPLTPRARTEAATARAPLVPEPAPPAPARSEDALRRNDPAASRAPRGVRVIDPKI